MINSFTAAQIHELRLLRREQAQLYLRCEWGNSSDCPFGCYAQAQRLAERIAELEKLLEERK